MKLGKKLSSVAMTFAVLMGTILPTTTPLQASEESYKLNVTVVGDGSVSVKDVKGEKVEFAVENDPLETSYTKGSKIAIECTGEVSELLINEKAQELETHSKFDFEINEDTDIKVAFANTNDDRMAAAESQELKDDSPDKVEEKTTEEQIENSGDASSSENLTEEKETSKEPQIVQNPEIKIDYNNWKLTDEDHAMLEDYAKGITEPYKEIRKEIAERTGLIKFTDDDFFLKDDFYELYSFQMLMFDRTWLLTRNHTKEYKERAKEMATLEMQKVMVEPRAMSVIDSAIFSAPWGVGWIDNGLWRLSNNKMAFCGNGMMASPTKGDSTTDPRMVDNAALRKALYYGYLGPGNILDSKGLSLEQQIVATNDFVSVALTGNSVGKEAVGGYHWNGWIGPLYNEIQSKPDPANWTAYIVDVPGKGTNWAGSWVDKQPLVYGDWKPKGNLAIVKRSSNPIITNGNNCYNLLGAEYTLYKDRNCTQAIKVFKLNDGNGDKSAVWDGPYEFDLGTYYLKETKAAQGYALDPTVHTVQVKETGVNHPNGAPNWTDYEVKDTPQSDPVGLLLGKVDRTTNQNKPQGSASLANAEFTVKFYAGENPNLNGKATRTWVLKTDKDGFAYLSKGYKVSGDDFYYNGNNDPTLPLGTVTIQETKAPQGYYINNEVFVRKITAQGNTESVNTYNSPKIPEQSIDMILNKVQIGIGNPIEGTVFTHTKPDGSTEDVITDKDGNIRFVGLAHGKHKLKEKQASNGYIENPHEVTFTVSANGITMDTDLADKNMDWKPGSAKSPTYELRVNEELDDYKLKLIKINDKDQILPGAEFTLYEDKECTKPIETLTTNETGILVFDNMKDRTTYYFKETKAPTGYRIPVDAQGNPNVYELRTEFTPTEGIYDFYVDGTKYTVANNMEGSVHLEDENGKKIVAITVINYISGKLPETGSNATLILMLVGASMFCLFALRKRFSTSNK